jgi:uncharacterized protein (DUF486 family)
MKALSTILLLVLSNAFMTLAWYGHLKFKEMSWSQNLGLVAIILISWGIALFEYMLQVPANRIGFKNYGGPFTLVLKGNSGSNHASSFRWVLFTLF